MDVEKHDVVREHEDIYIYKELQDLCHEWEVESMHNLSIQTPLGLLDFLVLPRGTLMICRCATSRVACHGSFSNMFSCFL